MLVFTGKKHVRGRYLDPDTNGPTTHSADELLDRIRTAAFPNGVSTLSQTWIRQEGEMKMEPGGSWLTFHAEQTFNALGIDLNWQAIRASKAGLL